MRRPALQPCPYPYPYPTPTPTPNPRSWCVAQPFDPDDSHVDEAIGYVLAAVGFIFQLQAGFSLFFPLNLLLLPLSMVEWVLRWQIVMGP